MESFAAALDSACGYAALSLMDSDSAVLTVEFKTSLLAPGRGDRFRIVGTVIKPGRSLTFCEGRAFALTGRAGAAHRHHGHDLDEHS